MDIDEIIRRYPVVFHMAENGSWPNIQRHGLLSTTALLDMYEISGDERFALESEWRPRCVPISHPEYGTAVIRDQIPMPEGRLRPLLIDMEPQQWYELINRKTFFWADTTGLGFMLNARSYWNKTHCVLSVDCRSLLESHYDSVFLTDMNSGSANKELPRGSTTFKHISEFNARWVTEFAIEYSVPNIADLTLRVEERRGNNILGEIWAR